MQEYLPEALTMDQARDVLFALDDLIMYQGFISHEEGYNEFGVKAQKIYNEIYCDNRHRGD